jgi:hypothetical protein
MASDISVIIASVITSWAVIKGFSAWKKEFAGKRNIELAEDTLALFYQAKDVISYIRSPGSSSSEGQTRKCHDIENKLDNDAKTLLNSAYIAFERYHRHQELFNRIYALRYTFEARFGKKSIEPFEDLQKELDEIWGCYGRLSRYLKVDNKPDQLQEYEKIIWEEEGDEIKEKVKGIIKNIEEIYKNIINGKSL